MPNDPKWRTISKISGQPIALVQAIYLQLLVSASQNPVTDSVTGVTLHVVTVTNEDIASALDVTTCNVDSVTEAMQGRVLDGDAISGWDKRQAPSGGRRNSGTPAKSVAQRVREYRERKKAEAQQKPPVTDSNVTVTLRNDVTPLDKNRIDKNREDLKDKRSKNLLPESEKIPIQAEGPVFISLPLSDGKSFFDVTEKYFQEQALLYPGVNLAQEFRNMRGWLDSNPTKRKTSRGVRRFITTWLQNSQDKPRGWQSGRLAPRDINQISQPDDAIPTGFRG